MINSADSKTKHKRSLLAASAQRGKSLFREPDEGRSTWLGQIAFALYLLGPVALVCFWNKLPNGVWIATFIMGWLESLVGLVACARYCFLKDRAAFVAATLLAPDKKDLLMYISTFAHGDDKLKAQTSPILCELLERLSEDELARIPKTYWSDLCPHPEDTPSGYLNDKQVDLYDPVLMAAFSAIRRLKRVESLPTIKEWRKLRKTGYHSRAFVLTLQECYETLLRHQTILPDASTLLRPSSAGAATHDVLLRPVMGTRPAETAAGEQLLRASQEQNRT